jgi:hypothetical protein
MNKWECDKDHDLAIEYRYCNGHTKFILTPIGAWPLPILCECGNTLYPLGSPEISEKEKLDLLSQWMK